MEAPCQKDEAAPKPVVAASLILSSAVLLPTLAENNSCVKVKRVGLVIASGWPLLLFRVAVGLFFFPSGGR